MRSDLDQVYRDLRRYAFAIAYRMLGSVSEAAAAAETADSLTMAFLVVLET